MTMQALEIHSFPLSGTRLIEASAGTGKTYTLAGLFLRLLLDTEPNLDISRILVVTFTEAATQELRSRIRSRIQEALHWFEDDNRKDALLEQLDLIRHDQEKIQRLNDALIRMDEAAIFTIHGFCHRILNDNAFESQGFFENELITDETPLLQGLILDFWRTRLQGVSLAETDWIIRRWASPGDLLLAIGPILRHGDAIIEPAPNHQDLEASLRQRDGLLQSLRTAWSEQSQEIVPLLQDCKSLTRAKSKKNNWKPDNLEHGISSLNSFLGSDAETNPGDLPENFSLFTSGALQAPEALIKEKIPPVHPFFDLAQGLSDCWSDIDQQKETGLLMEAASYLRENLVLHKQRSRLLFFDDLLIQLDAALSDQQGHAGMQLAARVRDQYPVAMIDEFQDTDPVQYRIFKAIYPQSGTADHSALFMVGDPKQAIYRFRGADIFTYIKARRDTDQDGVHYTLDKNWRSDSRLVSAINHLFEQARAPFVFNEDIPFYPVNAANVADKTPLSINGQQQTPLVAWLVRRDERQGVIPRTQADSRIAAACAAEIALLLSQDSQEEGGAKACIGDRPVRSRDIAVLVRNRFEAADIQSALTEISINSVFISRDSVFETREAQDLAAIMLAISSPRNTGLLKAALITQTMGMDAQALHQLSNQDDHWSNTIEAFEGYRSLWKARGFMPMFHHLIHEQEIASRLLSSPMGNRPLTNLMQLSELIHLESQRHAGIENTLRWFDTQISSSDGNKEAQQLRLESDENLVQVVTIHKSKGLQYPIVFLPYLWANRPLKETGILSYHDEQTTALHLDLGSSERKAHLQIARKEALAEDLRLLYVALTRAQHRCYFAWGQLKYADNSGLAWLLHQEINEQIGEPISQLGQLTDDEIEGDLNSINQLSPGSIQVRDLPAGLEGPLGGQKETTSQFPARIFNGHCHQRWRTTSFSHLTSRSYQPDVHDLLSHIPDYDSAASEPVASQATSNEWTRFNFPRGAHPGEFLHSLLEDVDFSSAAADSLDTIILQRSRQFGIDADWQPMLNRWLIDIIDTTLNPETGLSLRVIPTDRRFVELAFHYPISNLDLHNLIDLVSEHRQAPTPQLQLHSVNGMMKGFIDLVFEHQGRFYLADYKSNHLGNQRDDYRTERLSEAIQSHDYDLQYLIYSVALHRYLKSRVKDYSYEQHFGGVYYLFLRGMKSQSDRDHGIYFVLPDAELIHRLDRLFAGQ